MPTHDDWTMTEDQLLAEVTARCDQRRIRWVHVTNVHHSKQAGHLRGFPDLFLCGISGVLFRELKSENGKWRGIQGRQVDWKWALVAAGQDWAVWTPSDLTSGLIDQQLARLARP